MTRTLLLFIFICTVEHNFLMAQDSLTFNIELTYNHLQNTTDTLYLGEAAFSTDNNNKSTIFSNPGHFTVTGKIKYPRIFILFNKSSKIYLYVDSIPLSIFVFSPDLKKTIVSGSEQQYIYNLFSIDLNKVDSYRNELYHAYDRLLGNIPRKEYDSDERKSLYKMVDSIYGKTEKLMEINSSYDKTKRHYYEILFLKYIKSYSGSYASAIATSLFYATRDSVEEVTKYKSEIQNGLKYFSDNMILNPVVNEYLRIANSLDKHKVGDDFPNIKLNDSAGTEHPILGQLENSEYLLIDFWASWCGPCIQNLNELKEIYNQTSKKKVNIITISIDRNKSDWLNAMERLKYPWVEVWSKPEGIELSNFYIPTIPLNYLVDRTGKIIKINATKNDILALLSK